MCTTTIKKKNINFLSVGVQKLESPKHSSRKTKSPIVIILCRSDHTSKHIISLRLFLHSVANFHYEKRVHISKISFPTTVVTFLMVAYRSQIVTLYRSDNIVFCFGPRVSCPHNPLSLCDLYYNIRSLKESIQFFIVSFPPCLYIIIDTAKQGTYYIFLGTFLSNATSLVSSDFLAGQHIQFECTTELLSSSSTHTVLEHNIFQSPK